MGADSDYLIKKVGFSCAGGACLFVSSFVYIVCYRHRRDDSEVPYLRELIKCERIVIGGFVLLLVPLFWLALAGTHPVTTPMTSLGTGDSWNFGWGRPCINFALTFVGFFLDYHPAARMACMIGMAQSVVLDTLSSYDLGTQLECVESGRCAENVSVWGLRMLNARDLASITLATWGLLLICHLNLVIGTCRIRYSFRRLHAGDHNRVEAMRTELAKLSMRRPVLHSYRSDDSLL